MNIKEAIAVRDWRNQEPGFSWTCLDRLKSNYFFLIFYFCSYHTPHLFLTGRLLSYFMLDSNSLLLTVMCWQANTQGATYAETVAVVTPGPPASSSTASKSVAGLRLIPATFVPTRPTGLMTWNVTRLLGISTPLIYLLLPWMQHKPLILQFIPINIYC